jgi:hypothetical protein
MIDSFTNTAREKRFRDIAYIRLAKEDTVMAHQFNFDEITFALDSEMEVR